MTASGSVASSRKFVLELDVLRGLAAILMIVNHAGYRLLSADDAVHSGLAPAVFLGSVAPAVVFFATGFGIGLSRPFLPRTFDWRGVLCIAALPLVAAGLLAMAVVMYSPRASSALPLRGVASLAVIPLHYAMLEVVNRSMPQPLSLGALAVIGICVIAASFFCSAKFASFVLRFTTSKHRQLLFGLSVGLLFSLCTAINFEPVRSAIPAALITMLAQLAVAALLGMGLPKRRA